MKGLDPQYNQHQIHLLHDARPVSQRRYRMNPNYLAKLNEEIDKLLRVGFIRPVKRATWLSPIVVVPKKNRKILVSIDYRKLNAATVTNGFPLPFTDSVLDTVAGHECHNFLDGFSGYNQICMQPDDHMPNQPTRPCRIFSGKSSTRIGRTGTQSCRACYGHTEQPERRAYAQPCSG